jgi:protease-4
MDAGLTTPMDLRMSGPLSLSLALPPLNGPLLAVPVSGSPCPADRVKVAVVDVDGPLVLTPAPSVGPFEGGSVALFDQKLEAAAATPGVGAVVLRLNSPGGGVTATELMYDRLQRFKARTGLPVIACLMEVGAGGAYYLATAADLIVAHPTTLTGGIGVILNLYNLRETMASLNLLDQSIKAGNNIDMATATRALSPEASKLLQNLAREFHQRFQTVVRQARPHLSGTEEELFDGRIFSGARAHALGLVDQLGDLEDALEAARTAAGCAKAEVVLFRHEGDLPGSPYAVTPSAPFPSLIPASIPGLERKTPQRTQLPTFLYMWLPEPS